jgi:hypothetical protein
MFVNSKAMRVAHGANFVVSELEIEAADRVAYQMLIGEMTNNSQMAGFLAPTPSRNFTLDGQAQNAQGFQLTERGKILVSFCKDD